MNLLPVIDGPAVPGGRRRRGLRAVGVALMILAAGTDLLEAGLMAALGPHDGYSVTPWLQPATVLPLCLAAVLWPTARQPAWVSPALRIAVPAGASVALTVVAVLTDWPMAFGLGEIATLLYLVLVAVRSCPGWWATAFVGLCGLAVAILPARLLLPDGPAGGVGVALLFPVMVAAVLGGYLRFLDHRRRAMVDRTRRSERLAMAADLHDFVAHHVTGILVQAQMAQMMATDPDQLRPVLRNIETSATEALASMRRTVGLLREAPDHTAAADGTSRPLGDLAALPSLVEGFGGGPVGPKVVVRRDPAVPDDLPPEVQTAAHRVVQEALTNVRRHAADADEVTVDLVHDGRALTVTVRDDGRGGTRIPQAARGGGFGLVGLTERVTALGGELRAGPRPTGQGWEVTAVLPTASSARA